MNKSERITAIGSGLAMAAPIWIASILWFFSLDFWPLPEILMPEDWSCLSAELKLGQIVQLVLFSSLILFCFGWLWGRALRKRRIGGGMIFGSSLLIGLPVPIVFCNATYGLSAIFFLIFLIGIIIAAASIWGEFNSQPA